MLNLLFSSIRTFAHILSMGDTSVGISLICFIQSHAGAQYHHICIVQSLLVANSGALRLLGMKNQFQSCKKWGFVKTHIFTIQVINFSKQVLMGSTMLLLFTLPVVHKSTRMLSVYNMAN